MTTTLLRHEWLRTRNLLGALMGAAVLATGLGSLLAVTNWPVISALGLIAGLFAIGALVPVLQFALAVHYWRSSYSRTGYFTHSLPVRGSRIYAAKLMWAVLVTLAGIALTVALALALWPAAAGPLEMPRDPFPLLAELWATLTASVSPLLLAAGALALLLLVLSVPVQLFFAASVGAEEPLNRYGLSGPVVVYVLLYLACQVAALAGIVALPWGLGAEDGQVALVSFDLIGELRASTEGAGDVVPIGFLSTMLLLFSLCLWRTLVSWNRKVSLV